jgi:hypothetical protein
MATQFNPLPISIVNPLSPTPPSHQISSNGVGRSQTISNQPTGSTTGAPNSSTGEKEGPPVVVVAAAATGSTLGVIFIAGFVGLCWRQRKQRQEEQLANQTNNLKPPSSSSTLEETNQRTSSSSELGGNGEFDYWPELDISYNQTELGVGSFPTAHPPQFQELCPNTGRRIELDAYYYEQPRELATTGYIQLRERREIRQQYENKPVELADHSVAWIPRCPKPNPDYVPPETDGSTISTRFN